MFSKIFPPIHTEGYKFLVIAGFVTLVLLFISGFLGTIGLLLTVWVYYFFRDPERVIIGDDNYLVSPADGEVIKVEEVDGPREVGLENKKFKNRKNIKYLGYIKNRKKFFDSIDIFIFPSFSEGLGLVLLEAMSFSKICLTRDLSPMNGYLSNESGYLFNDTNEMLDSLSQAINDYRLDSNKVKSKLFNIEEVVKKSSVASIFPLIEKVYNYE